MQLKQNAKVKSSKCDVAEKLLQVKHDNNDRKQQLIHRLVNTHTHTHTQHTAVLLQ